MGLERGRGLFTGLLGGEGCLQLDRALSSVPRRGCRDAVFWRRLLSWDFQELAAESGR